MLSLTTDEATLAPAKAEEKGKRKVEVEESSTDELLSLLKGMKDEM